MPTGTKTKAKKPARSTRRVPKKASKPERPKITVEDLSDFNESINLLIYGDSGVGKTVLAGGAPDAVFISTEKGTIAAKRAGSKAKLIRATSWETLEAAIEYIEANPGKFKWAILDSLTKMQVLLIRYILKKINEENESRDLDIPAIADHQKWQNMFKRFVDRLIDLEINVIFTATAMHREDAEGDDLVLPDIQGKDYAISQYVCAQMDSVFALVVKKKKNGEKVRNLITQTVPPFFAKDRFDSTEGDFISLGERDPENMENIIQLIEESAEYASIQEEGKKGNKRKKPKPTDLDEDEDDDDSDEEELDDEEGEEGDEEDQEDADDDEDEESADEEEDDDDEDEPEKPSKARSSRTSSKSPAKSSKARRQPPKAVEEDEDADDDDEEEEEAPARKAGKTKSSRRPARKPVQAKKGRKAGKATKPGHGSKDDDEDFDPDAEDDIEFDD